MQLENLLFSNANVRSFLVPVFERFMPMREKLSSHLSDFALSTHTHKISSENSTKLSWLLFFSFAYTLRMCVCTVHYIFRLRFVSAISIVRSFFVFAHLNENQFFLCSFFYLSIQLITLLLACKFPGDFSIFVSLFSSF